ncbi:5-formyltetrahydrofolate cyclo-ligase [Paenibacillus monticola]|uniref:5-formyltetrahydrofolate cyclo-ligase n=1 Tax=Paenibacillus monticola TaxID=2666075 RepID=A0A7X2H137_9BACL|nr:5-formyltetrahydrofolate cyclo-ligase [Paenibacillus monticola]MRN51605.1 5-formyltetrahydrofolate cyclo-ligase [Paenibacillus monticola]
MTGKSVLLAEVKRELRVQRATARDKLPAVQREQLSSQVCSYAWEWMKTEGAASLLAYVPFRSELDTRPLITRAWEEQCEVLLPRVLPGNGAMTLHKVRSWNELAPGAYGILEPTLSTGAQQESEVHPLPNVIFVPGLAFDLRGGRLGYGRGYYDRLRAAWETNPRVSAKPPVWIGLAYGMQIIPEVPMAAHDAFMDLLITENGILHCRKGE